MAKWSFFRVVDQIDKEYQTLSENDTLIVCKETHRDLRQFVSISDPTITSTTVFVEKLPVIYFVTPTYPRREQIAELTRLANTLMHVRDLFWIVADDSESCSPYLDKLLDNFGKLCFPIRHSHYHLVLITGIPYVHLSSPMPFSYRSHKSIPRGYDFSFIF